MNKLKEISQADIRFNNLRLRHQTGHCHDSEYKTLGNVIHWLYVFSNMIIAETVQIGRRNITFKGELMATYKWSDSLQMPIFTFVNQFEWIQDNQDFYLRIQDMYNGDFPLKEPKKYLEDRELIHQALK